MTKLKGYSFIEILITLTIISLLLHLGCGAFGSLLDRYHSESVASSLFQHLQFARTEAIKRNRIVSLCPSLDFQYCTHDWTSQYMVFIAQENFPIRSENLLRTIKIPNSVRITSTNQAIIKYNGDGRSLSRSTISISMQKIKEKIVIYDSGRARISRSIET